ncbi:MAG: hypothetical protein CENE_01743 [Candidatus Celerinatantimonas neptuna]|nr:MAG: hypothetical protein CENE_01743 [Candidatus Celerinatantimonas neptuna]
MTTTSQQRRQKALQPGYFKLHELSFEQLLIWAKQLAHEIPYYNEKNQLYGTWERMFEQNELVICATILSIDIKRYKQQFKQAYQRGEDIAVDYLFQLLEQFNQWYQHLPNHPQLAYQLKFILLTHYQSQLIDPLQQLLSNLAPDKQPDLRHFDSLWQLNRVCPALSSNHSDLIGHCFSQIILTISALQKECRPLLESSFQHGEHPPQMALYISFLKLFQQARRKINQFTQCHLNFYYQDVLGQTCQPTPENQVYLKLSLTQNNNSPVAIKQNAIFSPGHDQQFNRIDYQAAYPILVTDAEVQQAFSLTFNRDQLIAPEHALGFTSSINGQSIDIHPKLAGADLPALQSFELFNASTNDPIHKMGIIITDSVLIMGQGERNVSLDIHLNEKQQAGIYQQLYRLNQSTNKSENINEINVLFNQLRTLYRHTLNEITPLERPSGSLTSQLTEQETEQLINAPIAQQLRELYRYFFLMLLKQAKQPESFYRVLGLIISRHTLSPHPWLSEDDIKAIVEHSRQTLSRQDSALATIEDLLIEDKKDKKDIFKSQQTLFTELYSQLFDLQITTAEGWQEVPLYQIYPLTDSSANHYGFTLTFTLEAGFPAVICASSELHGTDKTLTHPALKLTLKAQTNCFPYSIFRDFELNSIQFHVEVNELTQLQLFNNEGQTDPSQPFLPFGVRPTDESYLVVACEEIARKKLDALTLHMQWAELPHTSDGFRQHYQYYPYPYRNQSMQIALDVLSHGLWHPLGDVSYPLFEPKEGPLNRVSEFHVTMHHAFTPVVQDWPAVAFSQQTNPRNGLFKIKLTGPETAFGHQLYSPLLSQILLENAKKKKNKPLPNAPYTPKINHFSLNYQAHSQIQLDQPAIAHSGQIYHLHPFGSECIYPPRDPNATQSRRFFANYPYDGYLYIGLSASELSGYLNLFFLLDGQSEVLSPYPSQAYHWAYLVDDRWCPLSAAHIVHDTTRGFITTGIVTLDLPEALNTCHNVMPDGLYWLCVSTSAGIGEYPHCRHIATHALAVNGQASHIEQFVNWQAHPKPANLAQINQLTPLAAAPAQEDRQQWILRVSEYLRHKNQAITPWDYEHLVLQHFSDIGIVSCFAHHRFDDDKNVPGHVLIIVSPKAVHCHHTPCETITISSATLLAIQHFLQSVSRSACQIEVRNPGYETIEVHCHVAFESGTHHGLALRKLEYAINQYLCPWQPDNGNQGLGWQLSLAKLTAFISQFPQVTKVSGLSVLKISQRGSIDYHLQDSAATQQPIQAMYPWYLLLPAEHHSIQVMSKGQISQPQPVGIGELIVGEQFIVNSAHDPQKREQ